MPKQIPFGKPMIGEEERSAVMDVMAGPILVHGPQTVQFENDFATFTDPSAMDQNLESVETVRSSYGSS